MRPGVRTTLVAATLGLTALPMLFLFTAALYEGWVAERCAARLERAVTALALQPDRDAAEREGVEAQLLDASGLVTWDSHTEGSAIRSSLIGGVAERAVELLFPDDPAPEPWAAIAPILGWDGARDDVRRALAGERVEHARVSPSGQSAIYALTVPRPGGGAITAVAVSRRGIRRLLGLHHDLAKLLLLQVLLALAFALVLSRRLVGPLEDLTEAARRYPARPIAGDRLLGRGDELGQLARSFSRLAEQLEARRRGTAELGADVAHEFKNPLATIGASAELIAGSAPLDGDRRALIGEQLADSVARLQRGIDRLLGLVRLEAEMQDEAPAEVDYRALVDAVLAPYRADPHHEGTRFTVEIAAAAARPSLIEARWRELLRNLVDNALVQPPGARRELVIEAAVDGTRLVTRVRDFGPGVSPGNRDKIFRRFFSQRPTGAAPGTGLGLSIVAAIAAAHGGTVTLGEPEGPGALFIVDVPR